MLNSTQIKTLDIQDLLPGMVIIRVVKQNGPIKIKKSGLVTSLDMVQGLIEMGIQQVETTKRDIQFLGEFVADL